MKTRFAIHLLALTLLTISCPRSASAAVTIDPDPEGQYQVKMDGRAFTTLHTQGFRKPILYPILGPHGIRMTRDYPMKEGTAGEAKDHPHQQSLWYTHGSVNGVSFWEIAPSAGRIVTTKVGKIANQGDHASIEFDNRWVNPKDETVCTDRQKITFRQLKAIGGVAATAIDYEITLHASEGDLVFGDTKEGTMGIRTHPGLHIDKGAKAVNSEGVQGKDIWGKRAKWVDYAADIDGHTVGIAILDHPSNPRHPTWWHAREYGLVAANPFGISDFEKKPKGTGNLKVPHGESITFRYRFIFHPGATETADIAGLFQDYADGK